ncbi:hypothetical protein CLIB1423_03S02498 [[Candida] railenensis]|uniref:Luciferase-like domain-containing protein n=1 Tax=[Candida] railenensis TaxID=45579 RepID=A0A9P0QLD0_9ASCO|nr:hypothetical protein CLIB1423_03S02498 [[Candida] railenensis]
MTKQRKPLILNAFEMGASGHMAPGLWKHPEDQSTKKDLNYWIELAKLLEKGKFNAVFVADVLGGYDVYNGPRNLEAAARSGAQWPVIEPSLFIPVMAAATKSLAFGVTFSTVSEPPYHFTRRLATLDQLTNGRVGWNVVSSYLDSASRNTLNGEDLPAHDERYQRAEEYIQVVYKLFLSSWSDDAVKLDRESGIFTDHEKVREINHEGKFFKVPGPNIVSPTPQRLPVILQAGSSSSGKDFAARNAEVVFLSSFTPEDLGGKIAEIKKIAQERYGREEGSIKFIQLITSIIDKTDKAAVEKYKNYKSYGDKEGAQALFSGWTGIDIGKYDPDEELTHVESNAIRGVVENWTKANKGEPENLRKTRDYVAEQITVGGIGPVLVGTKETVADEIERWVNVSGVDGFNFTYTITPGSFEELVNELIPELRKRGLAWEDYPKEGLTYREQLFGTEGDDPTYLNPSHPAYNLRWRAGVTKEEFESSLSKNA